MAVSMKAIKGRIKSVKNTRKITKAMEMVSAAKMRKAIDAALNTRLYARLTAELMRQLSALQEPNYSLFRRNPVEKILMILVTSNRGLCGSFNSNVLKFADKILQDKENVAKHRKTDAGEEIDPEKEITIDVLGVGRKSADFARRAKLNLISVFDALPETPTMEEVRPITDQAIQAFKDETYDKVVVVYTHFVSSLQQDVKVRQLLPVSDTDLQKILTDLPEKDEVTLPEQTDTPIECYFLEPDRDTILEEVIPRLIEAELFQAVLESSASEHSSRMVAMKNATESAGEMIDSLTLTFNKARQAAITQEIAEIAGGAAALE
ncbi:MAG: ATP synthase F1 subunit gamma [Candidatus Magasanikbacteria bacterium]|jgi:F-type H+-transporting ATPase subunit gamma|nr:ATP synthase F1 subunit gamma [Candidatus Magasanikbacteria bacterium]